MDYKLKEEITLELYKHIGRVDIEDMQNDMSDYFKCICTQYPDQIYDILMFISDKNNFKISDKLH